VSYGEPRSVYMESYRRNVPRRREPASQWLLIALGLAVLAAVVLSIVALILAVNGSNTGLHATFTRQTVNVTLAGVCGAWNIDVIFGKVGSKATIEVPRFLCDGTTNVSDTIGGLRFTMPLAGYDGDLILNTGASLTDIPAVAQQVKWCVGGPNSTYCNVFNDSAAFVSGSVLYMGRSLATDTFLAPAVPYGPVQGFTLTYYTTNSTTAPVTGGAQLVPHMTSWAVGVALIAVLT